MAIFRHWHPIQTRQLSGSTQTCYHTTQPVRSRSSPSATRWWPPATRALCRSCFRRCKMSKTPSTPLRWGARSRSPRFIPWPCWLSPPRLRLACSTRRVSTRWRAYWSFREPQARPSLSTHTLSLRIRAILDLIRWRFACFNPTRAESIRGPTLSTPTCLTLRWVSIGTGHPILFIITQEKIEYGCLRQRLRLKSSSVDSGFANEKC